MDPRLHRAAYVAGYAEVVDAFPIPATVQTAFEAAVVVTPVSEFGLLLLREAGRREALRVAADRRRDALERRWWLELRPTLQRIAREVRHTVATAYAPREAVQPTPDPASTIETAIGSLADSQVWQDWQDQLTQAWTEAQAQGRVDAMQYLAALRAEPQGSYDLQFTQALDALRNLSWDGSQTWMDRIAHGLASDVGAQVADAIASGASYDDLLQLVLDGFGASSGDAINVLNEMLATGTNAGAIDLYGSEGLAEADILISPGACEICAEAESKNPWPLADAMNELPEHPNCRCAWAPVV